MFMQNSAQKMLIFRMFLRNSADVVRSSAWLMRRFEVREVSCKSASRFWRRRFLSVFTIVRHGGHLGHVTRISRSHFRYPYPWTLHIKFHFDWPSSFGSSTVLGTQDNMTTYRYKA